MANFALVKAEIIASEVDFAKKSKKLIVLAFRGIERVEFYERKKLRINLLNFISLVSFVKFRDDSISPI